MIRKRACTGESSIIGSKKGEGGDGDNDTAETREDSQESQRMTVPRKRERKYPRTAKPAKSLHEVRID